jgi:hypothetical protein
MTATAASGPSASSALCALHSLPTRCIVVVILVVRLTASRPVKAAPALKLRAHVGHWPHARWHLVVVVLVHGVPVGLVIIHRPRRQQLGDRSRLAGQDIKWSECQ